MGLDIFHAQAKREIDEYFLGSTRPPLTNFKPLQSYVQVYPNPHIDWEKMFSERGLIFGDYRLLNRATDGKYDGFAFVDADATGFDAPIRAVFSNEWQFPLLPKFMQRSNLSHGPKKAPHFFGPFATTMKSENVIFYDIVDSSVTEFPKNSIIALSPTRRLALSNVSKGSIK